MRSADYSDRVEPIPPSSPPLQPARAPRQWVAQHGYGLAALVVGALAFATVALTQERLWTNGDLRIALPFFAVTVALAATALAKREGARALPMLGLGLAAAAVVMGWVLLTLVVVVATIAVIVVMSQVL